MSLDQENDDNIDNIIAQPKEAAEQSQKHSVAVPVPAGPILLVKTLARASKAAVGQPYKFPPALFQSTRQ